MYDEGENVQIGKEVKEGWTRSMMLRKGKNRDDDAVHGASNSEWHGNPRID